MLFSDYYTQQKLLDDRGWDCANLNSNQYAQATALQSYIFTQVQFVLRYVWCYLDCSGETESEIVV